MYRFLISSWFVYLVLISSSSIAQTTVCAIDIGNNDCNGFGSPPISIGCGTGYCYASGTGPKCYEPFHLWDVSVSQQEWDTDRPSYRPIVPPETGYFTFVGYYECYQSRICKVCVLDPVDDIYKCSSWDGGTSFRVNVASWLHDSNLQRLPCPPDY